MLACDVFDTFVTHFNLVHDITHRLLTHNGSTHRCVFVTFT